MSTCDSPASRKRDRLVRLLDALAGTERGERGNGSDGLQRAVLEEARSTFDSYLEAAAQEGNTR
ncbi:MAG: hypothetical protein ACOYM2_02275 [Rectinemataceae bacterium]